MKQQFKTTGLNIEKLFLIKKIRLNKLETRFPLEMYREIDRVLWYDLQKIINDILLKKYSLHTCLFNEYNLISVKLLSKIESNSKTTLEILSVAFVSKIVV